MGYLVVKQSGSNKSFELKTSVPAKPYMAVKTAVAGTAYLALGTNTTGTGMLVKGNGTNYKVVESYTTTRATSSTYNSYYTETTGTNYKKLEYFSLYYSRIAGAQLNLSAQIGRLSDTTTYLGIFTNGVILSTIISTVSTSRTTRTTAFDLAFFNNYNTKRLNQHVIKNENVTGIYDWASPYVCSVTHITNDYPPIKYYQGIFASSAEATRQTYSKATSYYTETITVQ